METGSIVARVKNYIFESYPNVFDFDIKDATNGGDELNVVVTFRTSISQVTPIRVKVIINKSTGAENSFRIYETKAEKVQGLKESSLDSFVSDFLYKEVTPADVDRFIAENREIISGNSSLERDEIVRIIENRLQQMKLKKL